MLFQVILPIIVESVTNIGRGMMNTVSEQLRIAMKNRRISFRDLSTLSGVPEETLRKLHSNEFDGEISTLARISTAMNITFEIGNTHI